MRRGEAAVLACLGAILAISAAWWALALWPLAADAPAWIHRTRAVCFGSPPGGLPDAAGWSLLIGEPIAMTSLLAVLWPGSVAGALRALRQSESGRTAMISIVTIAGLCLLAVAGRVRAATRGEAFDATAASQVTALSRPAPALALVDQHGDTLTMNGLRGRTIIIAFAFGHCTTVCPTVVREVLAARAQLDSLHHPATVMLVTLDPWRDTPARLPSLARAWALPADAHLVGGDTLAVTRALDAWGVARSRDSTTGEVTHATPVYIVDTAGVITHQAGPWAGAIVAAVTSRP